MNKSVIICLLLGFVWVAEILTFLLMEVFEFSETIFKVLSIVFLVLIISFHIWFLVSYVKNRKKVKLLQDQYIKSLKPTSPLRFCPSDEELMKSHFENITENRIDTNEKTPTQNEQSKESEELERE